MEVLIFHPKRLLDGSDSHGALPRRAAEDFRNERREIDWVVECMIRWRVSLAAFTVETIGGLWSRPAILRGGCGTQHPRGYGGQGVK